MSEQQPFDSNKPIKRSKFNRKACDEFTSIQSPVTKHTYLRKCKQITSNEPETRQKAWPLKENRHNYVELPEGWWPMFPPTQICMRWHFCKLNHTKTQLRSNHVIETMCFFWIHTLYWTSVPILAKMNMEQDALITTELNWRALISLIVKGCQRTINYQLFITIWGIRIKIDYFED